MSLRRVTRFAILALLVCIVASLATAMAAGNSVPESAAEDASEPIEIEPGIPQDCWSINFSNVIHGVAIINGTNQSDLIYGSVFADIINGGNGSDCILGSGGADIINGGNAKDVLVGGDGADIINGGNGQDICYGGPGIDIFVSCETIYP